MRPFAVIAIALGLAMDAFAVSIASGVAIRHLRLRHALKIAAWFGGFQALMPVLGWVAGITFRQFIAHVDHWVVFGILSFVGVKMIYEAAKMEQVERERDPLDAYVLFALALATSLDALAAGFSFAVLGVAIVMPVLVIGGITFVVSFAGVWIGDRGGHFFERKMEVAGGVLLIVIGIKVLITHLLQQP